MARRSKDAPIDLSVQHDLTISLIDSLACPDGKQQAFLRDGKSPGLRVRVTAGGSKAFTFEGKLDRETIRRTIGDVRSWTIDAARQEANRLRVLLDQRIDPRELERERQQQKERAAAEAAAQERAAVTVADAWARYIVEGKPPKKDAWKPRYRADLLKAAAPGGEPKTRGKGLTKPGHLAALMPLQLSSINKDVIRDWFVDEAKRGPVQAGRSVAIFSGFLSWCGKQRDYRDLLTHKDCAKARELSDLLPSTKRRTDALEQAQLPGWFAGIAKLNNRTAAVYLEGLLLTGARREELATLRWGNVDFQWRKITIADKVDATRTIPLTPYFAWRLASLPKGAAADFVFKAPGSKAGRITEPRSPHERVLADAGIPHVTTHGLRRSFSLMGEASGTPAGAIAQIMGHRPSALAEGYRPRSIDALRGFHEQIEAFILKTAGVDFDPATVRQGGLRVVAAA